MLQKKGTQPLQTYIDSRQTTVADWVDFRPIFEVCAKETAYTGGGGAPGAVVSVGGSWKIVEGHVRIYFISSKGAAVTGIWQAWWW